MLIVYVYHYEVMGISYNYLVLHYYISYYSPLSPMTYSDYNILMIPNKDETITA